MMDVIEAIASLFSSRYYKFRGTLKILLEIDDRSFRTR
jgi:hypothetical protein